MYLVFEGIDTAGKSTQVKLLKEKVPKALITKEPGGTHLGAKIRTLILHDEAKDSLTELFLFLADRREHYIEVVKPALHKKQTLISDRSFISGLAYALCNHESDFDTMKQLNELALDGCYPDAVVLFHLPKSTLEARLNQKSSDHIEQRGIAYLLEVQKKLLEVTQKLQLPYILIDASQSIEHIHNEIFNFYTQVSKELA